MQAKAYIHSIETMGMVDGPGIRYVIFMQGCPLRCAFCHNPDTWYMAKGQTKTLDWLIEDIKEYLPYFRSSGGGVTVTGGEPLLQAEFLSLLFAELKKLDIHRVIDTSGFATVEKVRKLMNLTDLVMMSIKHSDPDKYRQISGQSPDRPLALARYLSKINMPVWIRYVIIPGLSNAPADLSKLADIIKEMPNVQKLELLPYHTMGKHKWDKLGLSSPLLSVPPPRPEELAAARKTMAELLPGLKIV